jgi:protein phosphatase
MPNRPSSGGIVLTPERKPLDEEIDVFGLTHAGRVRSTNQDHFLLCSLHKTVRVHATSLPQPERLPLNAERLAFLGVVADGVGGLAGGEEASQAAIAAVYDYITQSLRCYYTEDPAHEASFYTALDEAVQAAHQRVVDSAAEEGAGHGATTLTIALAVWPRIYVVHVGDTRCYLWRDGTLHRITSDQTVAQALLEAGVLSSEEAERSPHSHVLTSAVGGESLAPVTNVIRSRWGDVLLLCSDGLTKHVSDDEIGRQLTELGSAEAGCHTLLEHALDGGGSDNVTVVIGHARQG